MKIAYLGWGSLIWDPRTLHVRGEWFADGPLLPIEFARESSDQRITLVIKDGSPLVRSLWTLSSLDSVVEARRDLWVRECNPKDASKDIPDTIAYWEKELPAVEAVPAEIAPPAVAPTTVEQAHPVPLPLGYAEIVQWATQLNLNAVVWTNLGGSLSAEQVIEHIRTLSYVNGAKAERYVRMTPRQIDTPVRRKLEQEFGWSPHAAAR